MYPCRHDGCSAKVYKPGQKCLEHWGRFKKENNPRWNGGQTVHTKGYVKVWVKGKYVMEHRLIMEQHLGRELTANENVHHKNGVRTDNRIENLELWAVSQPKGQRVEDLVQWAEEIISRYGSDRSILCCSTW